MKQKQVYVVYGNFFYHSAWDDYEAPKFKIVAVYEDAEEAKRKVRELNDKHMGKADYWGVDFLPRR